MEGKLKLIDLTHNYSDFNSKHNFNKNYTHVYIDSETTGLDESRDEILEVSAVEFNMNGDIGREFYTLCKPMRSMIPSDSTAIHGITDDMVSDKPMYLIDGVRDLLVEFIDKRPFGGHNAIEFDFKMLRINPKTVEPFDTLSMANKLFPGKRNNLKALCNRLKIPWDNDQAHRATYDVIQGIKAYIKMYNIIVTGNTEGQFNIFNDGSNYGENK